MECHHHAQAPGGKVRGHFPELGRRSLVHSPVAFGWGAEPSTVTPQGGHPGNKYFNLTLPFLQFLAGSFCPISPACLGARGQGEAQQCGSGSRSREPAARIWGSKCKVSGSTGGVDEEGMIGFSRAGEVRKAFQRYKHLFNYS